MLGLQSVVLLLTVPVMLSLTEVDTAVALLIGTTLVLACLVAAGTMRRRVGGALGWAVQVASLAMGFVVPVMFALGAVFLALYAGSWFLGQRIDREREERAAAVA
jgi:hypothetical protein